MIDEHEWRSVLQVVEDGTFSAAARHLFISQPSLSQCIKKIEGELGQPIFDRSQTPLALTEAGRIYVREARRLAAVARDMKKAVEDLSALQTGRLVIGSSHTRSFCYLAPHLVAFHRMFPGIDLEVLEGSVVQLKEYVRQGKVDFALLYAPLPEREFSFLPLLDEHVCLAIPQNYPLAAPYHGKQPLTRPVISFSALQGLPFIPLKPHRQMASVYEQLCRQTGTQPQEVFVADTIIGAMRLASLGMGATLVTDMMMERQEDHEHLLYVSLAEYVEPRHLLAGYGSRQPLSQAAREFIRRLQES